MPVPFHTFEHRDKRFHVYADPVSKTVSFCEANGDTFAVVGLSADVWRRINRFVEYVTKDRKSPDANAIETFKVSARLLHFDRFIDFVRYWTDTVQLDWVTALPDDGQFYYIKSNGDRFIVADEPLNDEDAGFANVMDVDALKARFWGERGVIYCVGHQYD